MTKAKPAAGFRGVVKLTEAEAEQLTAEIVGKLSAAYREVSSLIVRAFRGHAWNALGYTTWAEYCRAELQGPRMLRFTDEQLTELCAEFAGEGMSVRAIGSALGIGHATAARKVNKSDRRPAEVIGLDDRRQKRDRALSEAKAAHPAGKSRPTVTANLSVAEVIFRHISFSAGDGLTYLELCEITAWRDAPVTGALAGLKRSGRIEPGWVRGGHTAWVETGTDVLGETE